MYPSEEWRPVKDFEGSYEISSLGNVRSLDRFVARSPTSKFVKGRTIAQLSMPNGYRTVMLNSGGKRFRRYVHRLVAEAFLDNPSKLREVNHKDEDKSNNVLANLEWCSHSYNMKYAGGSIRRVRNQCKPVVVIDGDDPIRFESIASAAKYLGTSVTTVSKCCRHKKGTKRVFGKLTMFETEYINGGMAPLTDKAAPKRGGKGKDESDQ